MNRPPYLLVGAALALLEGLVLLVLAVLEVASTTSGRVGLAVGTAVFFTVVGAALVGCAWGLWQLRSWARSPVVVVQLILLLTAWSLYGDDTRALAGAVAGVSVVTLVCLLHPRSIEALATADEAA